MTSFPDRLAAAVRRAGSPLCVGIDPHLDAFATLEELRAFALDVVEAAAGRVAIVKPQFAFFEAWGPDGMRVLAEACRRARERGLLVLGDAKRGDIGTTAAAYARATLSPDAPFPCDALTVNPFLGPDTVEPFLAAADRWGAGLFVLLRTSNPGSAFLQEPVAERLGRWLTEAGAPRQGEGGLSPVGAVVGATHRDAVVRFREALPHAWLLLPGYGTQGATAEDVAFARRPDGLGMLVAASRAVTFPAAPVRDRRAWMVERIEAVRAELR